MAVMKMYLNVTEKEKRIKYNADFWRGGGSCTLEYLRDMAPDIIPARN